MNVNGLTKIKARTAAEVCRLFLPTEEASQLLREDTSSVEFLELLLENQLYPDAVAFLAQALPNREATWWACLCARHTLGEAPEAKVMQCLSSAEQWVYEPTDEHRRNAMIAAEASGLDSPSAWAAVAAFWSEGSMAPTDAPAVPPGQDLNGRAVAGAVMLAAVQNQPERAQDHYRKFFEQGLDVARGGSGNQSATKR